MSARRTRAWSVPVIVVVTVSVLAAAAWGATPKSGRYSGFVDPFKISFKVANGKITDLVTDFEATTCSGLAPDSNATYFGFPTLAIKDGRFTGSKTLVYPSGLDPHFTISGRFSTPTHAAGTLHEHIAVPKSFGAPSCTLSQPFSLTRVK